MPRKPDVRYKTLHLNKRDERIVRAALDDYWSNSGQAGSKRYDDGDRARELAAVLHHIGWKRRYDRVSAEGADDLPDREQADDP